MTTAESIEKDSTENLYDIIKQKLESLCQIKFAAYRVACKLRALQKYLKLTYVDYNTLVRAFNSHELQFGVGTKTLSIDNARTVLTAIYQLLSTFHFNESTTIENTVEALLKFLCEILDVKTDEEFDLNSFKIMLFALSNARLPEKYRCFFRQIASPNIILSQPKLTEFFEILLKLPNHFDDVDSFHADNIPACVQSCLDHTHDGIVREDIFVSWMSLEPQTLVWLPTLHRLVATETVRHEAQCNSCKAYPIIGMRYRCLRCFNFDLCQKCFFVGDHGKKHDGTHPIEEYCKQVTAFEDLKALLGYVKLKVGKNGVKRKERYLTIERSKSFSHGSNLDSNPIADEEQQPLTREVKSNKKSNSQDVQHSVRKSEINDVAERAEEKSPLTKYAEIAKKEVNNDQSIVNKEHVQTKTLNYITVEKKRTPPTNPIETSEDDDKPPLLMPKQHKPMKKSSLMKPQTEELIRSEHYQLPPNDDEILGANGKADEDDDDYRPPLPPKQRQQNNLSRALVYDFIGSELQELRATLAQFDQNSSNV